MENNGKGIFYGVIGVATLIVAIIGATFAYFTATAETEENISGGTERIGLTVEVDKVPLNATEGKTKVSDNLIPLDATNLDTALAGTKGNGVCIDKEGYAVCHLYKVTVTNTGAAQTTVNGKVTLNADTIGDLKARPVNYNEVYTSTGTVSDELKIASLVVNEGFNDTIQASGTAEYYFVVYLENKVDTTEDGNEGNQNDQQEQTYTGKVIFNAAGGAELAATFTE